MTLPLPNTCPFCQTPLTPIRFLEEEVDDLNFIFLPKKEQATCDCGYQAERIEYPEEYRSSHPVSLEQSYTTPDDLRFWLWNSVPNSIYVCQSFKLSEAFSLPIDNLSPHSFAQNVKDYLNLLLFR
jgi:hypothetical protein